MPDTSEPLNKAKIAKICNIFGDVLKGVAEILSTPEQTQVKDQQIQAPDVKQEGKVL